MKLEGGKVICPYCREDISDEASKCKHCGETPVDQPWRAFYIRYQNASKEGRAALFSQLDESAKSEFRRVARVLEQNPLKSSAKEGTSSANVIAGVASFIVPGLGQVVQGRLGSGAIHFLGAIVLWFFFLGWLVHFFSAYEAANHVVT